MLRIHCLTAIALLCASVAPAASAEPLQPTGKWRLNYEDAQCNAYRSYGTKQKPLFLAFKSPPSGSVVQLMVLQNGPRMDALQHNTTISAGETKALRTNMLVYRNKDSNFRVSRINLPISVFQGFRDAPDLKIDSTDRDFTFVLSDFSALMTAIDACVADLREHWNVSESDALNPRLSRSAIGDLQKVFKSEDYPWMAVRGEMQGTTGVVLLIDESGKVADCSVVETSGAASVDAQSCAIITERARFEPALDAAGNPARSSYSQRIKWMLRSNP